MEKVGNIFYFENEPRLRKSIGFGRKIIETLSIWKEGDFPKTSL